MEELHSAMYQAANAIRQLFNKDSPLVLHEPFHGLGGARNVAKICGIEIRLGNLSCDVDRQFAAYYELLAKEMQHPPVCNRSIMDVPMHEIEDAHGIFHMYRHHPAAVLIPDKNLCAVSVDHA